jgi:predicted unusual protein kinase regulating ubiquinone biosynthesis (AarF/ABC1/UbiB family)
MLLRGITILEGVCKELDPRFNYMRTLEPYVNKFMFNLDYIEKKAQKDIMKLVNGGDQSSDIKIEMMQGSIKRIESKASPVLPLSLYPLIPLLFLIFQNINGRPS